MISALVSLHPQTFAEPWVAQMHAALGEPLVAALRDADVSDPDVAAHLVNAVVQRAGALIERGADAAVVRRAVHGVLGATSAPRPAPDPD